MFIEYRQIDGYVVGVYEDIPNDVSSEHLIYDLRVFDEDGNFLNLKHDIKLGDEFQYVIYVVKNENDEIVGVSSIQQSPPAQYLLEKLVKKDQEINELKKAVLELSLLMGGIGNDV